MCVCQCQKRRRGLSGLTYSKEFNRLAFSNLKIVVAVQMMETTKEPKQ